MRIFGVILAGGGGRRMGGADKALLDLDGRPLIAHALDRLGPQVEQVAISANGVTSRFDDFGRPVLTDETQLGPLSGILAALRWAAPLGATAVVSVAVDTPFFPGDLVPQLCLAAESVPSRLSIATAAKDHPTFGHWPIELAPQLADFLSSGAKARVLDFAHIHQVARARFPQEAAFDNLNTPEDMARIQAMLRDTA